MRAFILVILFFFVAIHATAQETIAELDLEGHSVITVPEGMIIGDSLFLNYRLGSYEGSEYRSVWMNAEGRIRNNTISTLADKKVVAVTQSQDSIYYYYAVKSKKSFALMAVEQHKKNLKITQPRRAIEVPGILLGSFIKESILSIIYADEKNFNVKLMEINHLEIVSQKTFPLAIDLSRKKQPIAFVPAAGFISTIQASAPLKIIRSRNGIYISLDELPDEYADREVKTTVSTINFTTGEIQTRAFFESSYVHFNTYIHNDLIYRLYSDGRLEVYDFSRKDALYKGTFRNSHVDDVAIYRKDRTHIQRIDASKWRDLNFLIVENSGNGSSVNLVLGYYTDPSYVVIISPANPIMSLAFVVGSMIVNEASEKAGGYFYKTVSGTIVTGFSNKALSSVRTKIDKFEIADPLKVASKGYVGTSEIVFGIYVHKGSKKAQIVKFTR